MKRTIRARFEWRTIDSLQALLAPLLLAMLVACSGSDPVVNRTAAARSEARQEMSGSAADAGRPRDASRIDLAPRGHNDGGILDVTLDSGESLAATCVPSMEPRDGGSTRTRTEDAWVSTDRNDYPPGFVAKITAGGFVPNECVTLQVAHIDGTAEGGAGHEPWGMVADHFGNVTAEWSVNPDDSLGSRFRLTADGRIAHGETFFTDGSPNGATCSTRTDCASGYCDNTGRCAACTADGNCIEGTIGVAGGQYCDNTGFCAPRKADGATCNPLAQCLGAGCYAARQCINGCCDGLFFCHGYATGDRACLWGASCDDGNPCHTGGIVNTVSSPHSCTGFSSLANASSCDPDTSLCTPDQCSAGTCTHPAGNSGVTCRASTGECDPAEVCSGSAATCPVDTQTASRTSCTDDGNPCTTDLCDGTSSSCQHAPGNAGAVCRAAAGPCDTAETCSGSSATCPTDVVAPAATVCRSSQGECDVAETCTGFTGYAQTVSISSATSLNDFQVLIRIPTTNPLFSHLANAQGNDLRVTLADDATAVPYWIENLDPAAAEGRVWVKVTITGGTPIVLHLHYGNSSLTSSQSTVEIMEFGDEFTGSSLDTTKWTLENGSVTVGSGVLRMSSSGTRVVSSSYLANPRVQTVRVETRFKNATFASNGFTANGVRVPALHDHGEDFFVTAPNAYHVRDDIWDNVRTYADSFANWTESSIAIFGTWNGSATVATYPWAAGPTSSATSVFNSTWYHQDLNDLSGDQIFIGRNDDDPAAQTIDASWDWLIVRKYAATEPVAVLSNDEAPEASSRQCPANALTSAGTLCTADANPCTRDVCDGNGVCTHPVNTGATCDDGNSCTNSDSCKSDGTCAGPAVVCNTPPSDCYVAAGTCSSGTCSYAPKGIGSACADDGNPCTTDLCDGGGTCAHAPGNVGTVCRSAVSACDAEEKCAGSPTCPADAVQPSGTVCRAAAGDCDTPETCDGISNVCPTDQFLASSTVCRGSIGTCDVAEACTGTSPACPADAFAPASTVCRTSTGVCDIQEQCTGSSNTCPPDSFAPSSTVCRAFQGGCDAPENCTGSGASCPADTALTDAQCCTVGADTDGDGIDDCTERKDGVAWTDPNVFNGMKARLADHCHADPACYKTDTLSEVNACMDRLIEDQKDQSSGWDWQNPPDSSCSFGYNFNKPWTHCELQWEADWQGFIELDNNGTYCFDVLGNNDQACGTIFFNTETDGVTHDSGAKCYTVNAGIYPIRWYYEMDGGSQSDFHVDYCYSRTGTCTPTTAVPAGVLREAFTGTEQLCESNSTKCTDLCPCQPGQGSCTSDTQCGSGLVCGHDNGAFFGRPRTDDVCWAASCSPDPIAAGCGSPGAPCGTTCFASTPCTSDADCASGDVCGSDNGARFGMPGAIAKVCWPASCAIDPIGTGCGSTLSPCGRCECTPNCANATCASNMNDGCGGRCTAVCADRTAGCEHDTDCNPSSVCVIGGGPRVGLAAGTNVCLPAQCNNGDPSTIQDCGSVSSLCGLCPTCQPDCGGRTCGPDPKCGVDCATLDPNHTCSSSDTCSFFGTCGGFFAQSLVKVPTAGGFTTDVTDLPPPPTQAVGATNGQFSVSDKGTAVYEIPIAVAPGRAGIRPDLRLRYESTKADGLLGVGWSIDGLSTIARCQKSYPRDGWKQAVSYSDDRFCLDGQPLVATSGTYGADNTEYRTIPDRLARIVSHTKDGIDGPASFEVRTRDGRVLTYDSVVYAERPGGQQTAIVRAWPLTQVSDGAGSYMKISYTTWDQLWCHDTSSTNPTDTRCSTTEVAPSMIQYGGYDDGATRQPPDYRIVFNYRDDRADRSYGYTDSAVPVSRSLLLDSITSAVNDGFNPPDSTNTIRHYAFTYQSTSAGLSRLTSIQECTDPSVSRVCRTPTSFQYSDSPTLFLYPAVSDLPNVTGAQRPLTSFDWNGDGLDDLLVADTQGKVYVLEAHMSDGFSFISHEVTVDIPDVFFGPNVVPLAQGITHTTEDLNADGRDDFLVLRGSAPLQLPQYPMPGLDYWVDQLTSDPGAAGSFTVSGLSSGGPLGQLDFLTDVNGDGVPDVLGDSSNLDGNFVPYSTAKWSLGSRDLSTGNYTIAELAARGRSVFPPQDMLIDGDGNGLPDLFSRNSPHWDEFLAPTSGATMDQVDPGLPTAEPTNMKIIDVNADGAPDVLQFKKSSSDINQALGMYLNLRRNHFEPANLYSTDTTPWSWDSTKFSAAIAIDYDGDGRQDLLTPQDDTASTGLWIVHKNLSRRLLRGGDGFELGTTVQFPLPLKIGKSPAYYSGTGDFNGDGRSDLAVIDQDGKVRVLLSSIIGRSGSGNLLTKIDNGVGKLINVSYDGIGTDHPGSPYKRLAIANPDGSCGEHARCLNKVPSLVSEHTVVQQTIGTGTQRRKFEYTYSDAREELGTNQWLGFASRAIDEYSGDDTLVEHTDVTYDNTTYDSEYKVFPFATRTTTVVRRTPSATPTATIGGASAAGVFVTATAWAEATSSAALPFVYAKGQLTGSGEIVDGVEKGVSFTTDSADSVDQFGNVLERELSWGVAGADTQSSGSTTTATQSIISSFYTDADRISAWQINLPKRISKTSTRASDTKTQVVEYEFDSVGRLTSETREPDDNERKLKTIVSWGLAGEVDSISLFDAANNNRSIGFGYDEHVLFPESVTDPLGHVYQVRFDRKGGQSLSDFLCNLTRSV